MADLSGSTIASTYDRLLALPSGGLNGNNLVAITDGDSSTAIGMKVATNKIEIIPGSNDANAFEVSQADGTAVFTVNTSSPAFSLTGTGTITKAISASSGDNFLLNIVGTEASGADLGAGDNVGILFKTAYETTTSKKGSAIVATRESGDDTDSSTGIAFKVSQDDETLDEAVRIDHDGNVGIGESSPSEKLHIGGDFADYRIYSRTGIENGTVAFNEYYTGSAWANDDDDIVSGAMRFSDSRDSLEFGVRAGGATAGYSSTHMTIKSTGAVGIGTTAPLEMFDVSKVNNGGLGPVLQLTNDPGSSTAIGTSCKIKFAPHHSGTEVAGIEAIATSTGAATALSFRTHTGSALGERMRIAADGNVFINDSANADVTLGLTINQGANDDQILALKSSDITHGVTSYAETDTYGFMKKYSATQGGLIIGGVTTHERPVALQAFGNYYAAPSGGTGVDKCAIQNMAYEVSGTGITNVGSDESIFSVRCQKGGSMQTIFIVDTEGDLHSDGSTSITGYDYAEYFEWTDGNPDNEDRVGYSVVLDGDKIRKATEGETPIGIISGTPAVVGDNPMGWHGTWKKDKWGRKIPKEVEWVRWEYDFQSEEGAEVVKKEKNWKVSDLPEDLEIPDNAEYITRLEGQYSDEYDPSQSYTMREARQEWSAVGLMGKLRLRKGQPVASTWIKMRDEGNNIEMWLVK